MVHQMSAAATANCLATETDKHVLFGLAGETYALSLLQVQEVIADFVITVLPNLPDCFHGVTGVRGEVLPVLNLRQRFGFAERERDRRTRLLVIDMQPNAIAAQVDEVFRVASIHAGAVGQAPQLTCGQRTPFVLGVSDCGDGRLAIHLDMHEILSSLEKVELAEISESLRQSYRLIADRNSAAATQNTSGDAQGLGHADSTAPAPAATQEAWLGAPDAVTLRPAAPLPAPTNPESDAVDHAWGEEEPQSPSSGGPTAQGTSEAKSEAAVERREAAPAKAEK